MSAKVARVDVLCGLCGSAFQTTRARILGGRGRYCSRRCLGSMTGRKHGHSPHSSQSKTYNSWSNMLQRCRNPKATKYPVYGGAGITVCERWNSFENFLSDMGERPDGKTLDRIEGAKGYSPDNCRWATPLEQSAHIRNVRVVSYRGQAMTLTDLSALLGIQKSTLDYRLKTGWSDDDLGAKPWAGSRPALRAAVERGLSGAPSN